jgi:2-methylcitrate dehydratase PrpD
MQYCVAIALLFGKVSLSDFTPVAVHRPEVRALFGRAEMTAHADSDETSDPTTRKPYIIAITLKDGSRHEQTVQWAKGTIFNPFTAENRRSKFQDCCDGFLSQDDFDAAQEKIEALGSVGRVRDLTHHLVFEAGSDNGERFTDRYRQAAE